jgi:hypothetical protein
MKRIVFTLFVLSAGFITPSSGFKALPLELLGEPLDLGGDFFLPAAKFAGDPLMGSLSGGNGIIFFDALAPSEFRDGFEALRIKISTKIKDDLHRIKWDFEEVLTDFAKATFLRPDIEGFSRLTAEQRTAFEFYRLKLQELCTLFVEHYKKIIHKNDELRARLEIDSEEGLKATLADWESSQSTYDRIVQLQRKARIARDSVAFYISYLRNVGFNPKKKAAIDCGIAVFLDVYKYENDLAF